MSSIEATPSLYRKTPCGIANLPNQPAVVMRQILALGFLGGYHNLKFISAFERRHPSQSIRGTQRRFPPKYIENSFQAILSTIRSLEMRSKSQRYKICMCQVILEEHESSSNYKGFSQVLFSRKFQMYFNELRKNEFSQFLCPYIFQPENFCFPFFDQKQPNLVSEMRKIKLQKSQGIYKISFT